jgi:hypothetical protein
MEKSPRKQFQWQAEMLADTEYGWPDHPEKGDGMNNLNRRTG